MEHIQYFFNTFDSMGFKIIVSAFAIAFLVCLLIIAFRILRCLEKSVFRSSKFLMKSFASNDVAIEPDTAEPNLDDPESPSPYKKRIFIDTSEARVEVLTAA